MFGQLVDFNCILFYFLMLDLDESWLILKLWLQSFYLYILILSNHFSLFLKLMCRATIKTLYRIYPTNGYENVRHNIFHLLMY